VLAVRSPGRCARHHRIEISDCLARRISFAGVSTPPSNSAV